MLEMMMWDVDHGSAAYIKTPTGKHIVIDLGVGDMSAGQKEFSPLWQLRYVHGVTNIDWLVITHPHRDHIDDIGNLSLLPPRTLSVNRTIAADYINKGNKPGDADLIRQYNALLQESTGPASPLETITNSAYWGCDIKGFLPTYDGPNLNNYSLVVVITCPGSKIVIPGDNEEASWKSLLSNPDFVNAIKNTDVFVASHHGRASGYYGPLFDHFKPSVVLISDTNHGDTSVTDNYYYHATGWPILSRRTGQTSATPRYCLSTRSDGYILVKCYTGADGRNYREVSSEL